MALDPIYIAMRDVPDFSGLGGELALDGAEQAEVARLDATLPPPSMRSEDAFEASDISEHDDQQLMAEGQARRQRARSLIKAAPGFIVKA